MFTNLTKEEFKRREADLVVPKDLSQIMKEFDSVAKLNTINETFFKLHMLPHIFDITTGEINSIFTPEFVAFWENVATDTRLEIIVVDDTDSSKELFRLPPYNPPISITGVSGTLSDIGKKLLLEDNQHVVNDILSSADIGLDDTEITKRWELIRKRYFGNTQLTDSPADEALDKKSTNAPLAGFSM